MTYETDSKENGDGGDAGGLNGGYVRIFYSHRSVPMLPDPASCQRGLRGVFRAGLRCDGGFLHIFYSESDGNRKPFGVSGKYGWSAVMRADLSENGKTSSYLHWRGCGNRALRRNALLSCGGPDHGKQRGRAVYVCNAVLYEYGLRNRNGGDPCGRP